MKSSKPVMATTDLHENEHSTLAFGRKETIEQGGSDESTLAISALLIASEVMESQFRTEGGTNQDYDRDPVSAKLGAIKKPRISRS